MYENVPTTPTQAVEWARDWRTKEGALFWARFYQSVVVLGGAVSAALWENELRTGLVTAALLAFIESFARNIRGDVTSQATVEKLERVAESRAAVAYLRGTRAADLPEGA